jgi:hypothetical protein
MRCLAANTMWSVITMHGSENVKFSDIFYCPVLAKSFGFFLKKAIIGKFSTLWELKDIACKYSYGCIRVFIDNGFLTWLKPRELSDVTAFWMRLGAKKSTFSLEQSHLIVFIKSTSSIAASVV